MNHTTINTTFSISTFCFQLRNLSISPDVRAAFIARIVVNALTCPFIIVLNILVMVAVKTKPQLRTKSNIALACLSTTDLVVGLVLQPLSIANESLLLRGDITFCSLNELSKTVTLICLRASFYQLIVMSAERYIAIKHPFAYESQVSEVRIIMASALAWTAAIILISSADLSHTTILIVSDTLLIILLIYSNVSVYKEVRRNRKQIAADQVSLEAKNKLLKNRKAFYTTVIVLLVILLCYVPSNISSVILLSFTERIPLNIKITAFYVITLLPVLNSLFNPLIYAVRLRNFRVAVIQLLSRKTIAEAEEIESKIFGQRQIGVNSNVNAGQRTQPLNDEHEPTRQVEPHGGCEETPQ